MTPQYGPFDPEALDPEAESENIPFSYNNYETNSLDIQQLLSSSSSSISQGTVLPTGHSFYQVTVEGHIFKINCKETDRTVDDFWKFPYRQKYYNITYEYVAPSIVANLLNERTRHIYPNLKEHSFVEFSEEYKIDFESKLKPYLNEFLAQIYNPNVNTPQSAFCDDSLNTEAEEVEENKIKEANPCKWTKETTESLLFICKNNIQELQKCGSISKNISHKHWKYVSEMLNVLYKTHQYTHVQCAVKFKNLKQNCKDITSKCQYKNKVQEILDIIDSSPKKGKMIKKQDKKASMSEENTTLI